MTQVGRGGLLFRFACSVVLWGGRNAVNKYHWCVWGAFTVFRPHWFALLTACLFSHLHCSGSRLLYRERALSWVHFPGLSRSGSGSRVLHKGANSVGPAFCAFPFRVAQGIRSLPSVLSPVQCDFSPPCPHLSFQARQSGAPCVSSGKLISRCNPPSTCQPSRISGSLCLETGSLFAVC